MARLNVSIPDELHDLASHWRHSVNLSQICARALKEELQALDSYRTPQSFLNVIRPASSLERTLATRFNLNAAIICPNSEEESEVRDILGQTAAAYLDEHISDGSILGVAGGRQMWCMVRNISPRRVKVEITPLGIQQNDPLVLHAHSNTLATLLWLLYSPRSEAYLIGSRAFSKLWEGALMASESEEPKYFIVSSCSAFAPNSPFGELVGNEIVQWLAQRGAYGDFAYQFLNEKGEALGAAPVKDSSVLSIEQLQKLSVRNDARVVLVAAGRSKQQMMSLILRQRLCNVVVTDERSALEVLASST